MDHNLCLTQFLDRVFNTEISLSAENSVCFERHFSRDIQAHALVNL